VSSEQTAYDVTVVGGGHNGLVSAAYLARSGLSVLVLERLDHVGGAAAAVDGFAGHDARLSRYSALGSLLPDVIVSDLELDLELRPQPVATAVPDVDAAAWRTFRADVDELSRVVADSLLEPLPTERTIRGQVPDEVWDDLVGHPLGAALERRFTDDGVRGRVASEALVGTSTSLHDPSLVQNRSFLYHQLGRGPDGWRLPVGGPTVLAEALARAASDAGAEIVTAAGASAIRGDDDGAEVTWHRHDETHTVRSRHVLGDVAPWVQRILMGDSEDADTKPQGSQLVLNLLLERLPRLRSGVDPRVAFAGTLPVVSGLDRLEAAYADAAAGRLPSTVPGRLDCPSLADPRVLGDSPDGVHALTFLGTHTPASLFEGDLEATKAEAVERAIAAIDDLLAEPLASCLAADADGRPCVAATIPQETEAELAMPGGHLFHGDLEWPWASNRARLDTPAQRWGVQTVLGSVLVCGSGARRGGGVSGVGGHNAAQAVLASR
jgi:phytoene dehydrogenase-like protein